MHWAIVLALLLTAPMWSQPELTRVDAANFLPPIRAQVEEAERAVMAHPRDAKTVGTLAMTLHAYQQYDSAARAYSRAHLLDPQNFDWLYLLGAVRMELGEFESARITFRSALDLVPDADTARLRLAQADTALGRLEEAADLYRQILRHHAAWSRAWYGLGRVQAAKGDHASASQSYAKACELSPEYGAAHFALAHELRRSGQTEEARRHAEAYAAHATTEPMLEDPLLQRVSELNHGAQVHMQRAAELEKAGRLEDAVREQEAALAADPVNVQAHVNLIALYGRVGDPERATAHFEAAVRLSPGRSDLWYNYGVLMLHGGDLVQAEKAFRHALEINPDNAEAHDNVGVIYERRGDLDDAAREFRLAVASRPDYPLPRFHLGRILANKQQYDEAVQQFLRALEPESDGTPTYLYALAATFARAGRRNEALRYFRRARSAALAHGQSQLLANIERDMKGLGAEP